MESRALELLELPDDVLFAHGGCHVFALTLREVSGLPLLWIRDENGLHDHLACDAGSNELVDFFGISDYEKYRSDEMLEGVCIRFSQISVGQVESRFVYERSRGYYVHKDFFDGAKRRAQRWIERHLKYFDGTMKAPIPGVLRIRKTSAQDKNAIWLDSLRDG